MVLMVMKMSVIHSFHKTIKENVFSQPDLAYVVLKVVSLPNYFYQKHHAHIFSHNKKGSYYGNVKADLFHTIFSVKFSSVCLHLKLYHLQYKMWFCFGSFCFTSCFVFGFCFFVGFVSCFFALLCFVFCFFYWSCFSPATI